MGLCSRLIKLSSMASCASVTGWAGRGLPRSGRPLHHTLAGLDKGWHSQNPALDLWAKVQDSLGKRKDNPFTLAFNLVSLLSFKFAEIRSSFCLQWNHNEFHSRWQLFYFNMAQLKSAPWKRWHGCQIRCRGLQFFKKKHLDIYLVSYQNLPTETTKTPAASFCFDPAHFVSRRCGNCGDVFLTLVVDPIKDRLVI